MKKLSAFLGALFITLSAVSCGAKKEVIPESAVEIQAENMMFKSADIDMGGDFSEILSTDKRGAFFLIFGKLDSGEYCGYMTDPSFLEKTSFTITPAKDETMRCAAIMSGGRIAVLSTIGSNAYIYTFTKDCEPDKTYQIDDLFDDFDNYAELLCADDGFYINIARHDLAYADKEGNFKGMVNVNGRTVCGISMDSGGTPCVLLSEGTKTFLATLDDGNIAEETNCGELAEYTNTICRGEGEYRIAAMVTSGMYALKDDNWVRLTDFVDNDFGTSDISDMEMISDTELAVVLRRLDGTYSMRYLSQRDIAEIKQKKVFKMAYTFNSNTDPYDDAIKRYNADNDEYKLELAIYSNEDYRVAYDNLRLDIISGNCPDIVIFNGQLKPESFGSRGSVFADLYEFIDNDDELSRDDFLPGFLEGMETDGKLLSITPSFTISTNIIKNKFAEGLTSWDIDDLDMLCKKMPENMTFSKNAEHYTKTEMFMRLIDFGQFVDMETGECSFDTPEFIHILEVLKDNGIGVSLGEYISGGTISGHLDAFRNDENLIRDFVIFNVYDIRCIQYVDAGEDYTFIGFPGKDRVIATYSPATDYGIMANSPYKEEAWNFLKYYMFSEDSIHHSGFGGIPALEKYYKQEFEYECQAHKHTDPFTRDESDQEYYYYYPEGAHEPTKIEMYPFTEEEAKKYDDFIRTALKHHRNGDYNIGEILKEELDSYFEGEKSAEQVAEIIQNRASIYLSEKY